MAIATCHEFVAAERRYRADPKTEDPTNISVASLVAKATSGSSRAAPILLHGYNFRLLSTQGTGGQKTGQFALIAYPAKYRSSGVMTFIVTANDVAL